MREVSINDISKKVKTETEPKIIHVKPEVNVPAPVVQVSPPVINLPDKKGSYVMRVLRDKHGRVDRLVVEPYESV